MVGEGWIIFFFFGGGGGGGNCFPFTTNQRREDILPDMAGSKVVTESLHDGAHLLVCSAYQNNDINEFEKILKTNRRNIMEDPFIREHIEGGYGAVLAQLTSASAACSGKHEQALKMTACTGWNG